jgi:hypothetical protein
VISKGKNILLGILFREFIFVSQSNPIPTLALGTLYSMTISMPFSHSVLPPGPSTFSTERLHLAIFLHASQRLPFLRCEAGESGKIRFVFEDSSDSGPQAELEFDRGEEVPATALFASQKYLRRAMSTAINRRNGKPEHEYRYY